MTSESGSAADFATSLANVGGHVEAERRSAKISTDEVEDYSGEFDPVEGGLVDEGEAKSSPPPSKKRRKSRATYSARTIAECRKRGWLAGNVERRIPFPKPQGTTIDLFGVIDIIALDPSAPRGERTIGIQTTSGGTGGSLSPHRAKMLAEPRMVTWIQAGNRLELWTWAKQGAAGKAKRWTLRVERFSVDVAGELFVLEGP